MRTVFQFFAGLMLVTFLIGCEKKAESSSMENATAAETAAVPMTESEAKPEPGGWSPPEESAK